MKRTAGASTFTCGFEVFEDIYYGCVEVAGKGAKGNDRQKDFSFHCCRLRSGNAASVTV